MSCGSCSSGGCGTGCGSGCGACKPILAVVTILVTIAAVAALVGVYQTHMTPDGWVFGSLNGSLALLTAVVTLLGWMKLVKKLCPCRGGGVCPGCGCDPCKCK